VENPESLVVVDASGQQIAYLYFEDESQRQMSMRRLTKDEAQRIARQHDRPGPFNSEGGTKVGGLRCDPRREAQRAAPS
jgi:hypothetical protein